MESLRYQGRILHCARSNQPLSKNYEVDHCFPYSVWPCDDLWNLFPTNKQVNNRKSSKLISRDLLHRSREHLLGWWSLAHLGDSSLTRDQFLQEVQLALPLQSSAPDVSEIFTAMDMHRARMKQTFRLPEWDG